MEPNLGYNLAQIEVFRAFCARRGWATAAVAMAWVMAQGEHIIAIPGTRSAEHLGELAQGAEIALSEQDLAEIEAILPVGFAHGSRYAPAQWPGVEIYG